MARTTKHEWLEAGLQILAGQGAPALTIERLTEMLGLTKGSFYHHFQGLPGYKAALLDYLETQTAHQIGAASKALAPPTEQIQNLVEIAAISAPAVEIAVRAWSLQDDDVRQVQERVDSQRIAFAQTICRQFAENEAQALLMSRLAYALMVGCTQIQPPLPAEVRRQLFAEFLQLYHIEAGESLRNKPALS